MSVPKRFVLLALLAQLLVGMLYAADSSPYKWYTNINQLRAAVKQSDRPVIVFAGKPSCHVCETVWSDYLKATSAAFLKYMEENQIYGFRLENDKTFSNYATWLASQPNGMATDAIFGGGVANYAAPYFTFIKLKGLDSTSAFSGKGDTEVLYGVVATTDTPKKNLANTTAWMTKLMKTDEFKEDFPDATPLTFWETAEELGLNDEETAYDTNHAVRSYETNFKTSNGTLNFRFDGKVGKRYVFSVRASSSVVGAPTLEQLLALESKLSYVITKVGASASLQEASGSGFQVLDRGIFFEPTEEGTYQLSLTLSPASAVPFRLCYHSTDYEPVTKAEDGTLTNVGTLYTPMWEGIENGKWSMDYEAALANYDSSKSLSEQQAFFLCFSGCTWCPYCVAFDKLVAKELQNVANEKGYPLVIVDNRRRGETTGPSLLYAKSYQEYVKTYVDEKITDKGFEEKLAANQDFQENYSEPGKEKRIDYFTVMLCVPSGNSSCKVVGRVSLKQYQYPKDTDFKAFAEELVKLLEDLRADDGEEKDNYASTSQKVVELIADASKKENKVSFEALIGGFDKTDWRTLDFKSGKDWIITVKKKDGSQVKYPENVEVSLGLYDTSGVDEKDGSCLTSSIGSWEDGVPSLECRGFSGVRRLKISVTENEDDEDSQEDAEGTQADAEGTQEDAEGTQAEVVVPYVCVFTETDLPPYDIQMAETEYCVAGTTDVTADVAVNWFLEEDSSETGWAYLALPEGISFVSATGCPEGEEFKPVYNKEARTVKFAFKGANGKQGDFGTITLKLKIDGTIESSVESKDYELLLSADDAGDKATSRLLGDGEAELRLFTLPAFQDYENEETVAVLLVQTMEVYEWKLPIYCGTGGTVVATISGTIPDGLQVKLVDGGKNLVISGKPSEKAKSSKVVVQLKAGTQNGAKVTFDFTVLALKEVNPTAANTTDFSGTLLQKDDVVGLVKIQRTSGTAITLTYTTQGKDTEVKLEDWNMAYNGDVYVVSDDGNVYLWLTTDGIGIGELGDYDIDFRPNISAEDAKEDYAGVYNISLEPNNANFRGYGYLILTIAEDGSATAEGKLPDGATFKAEKLQLAEEAQEGYLPLYYYVDNTPATKKDDNASSTGETKGTTVSTEETTPSTTEEDKGTTTKDEIVFSGALRIVPRGRRPTGEACVSACNSGLLLKWQRNSTDESMLNPCGSEYFKEESLIGQLDGYSSFQFNVILNHSGYFWYEGQVPEAGCAQLLPVGYPLKIDADTVVLELEKLPAGVKDSAQLKIASFTKATGVLTGTFNLVDKNANATAVSFDMLVTPIPNCCGAGPKAVAYGYFLTDDGQKSWPVYIGFDDPLGTADVQALETAAQKLELVFSEASSGTDAKVLVQFTGVATIDEDDDSSMPMPVLFVDKTPKFYGTTSNASCEVAVKKGTGLATGVAGYGLQLATTKDVGSYDKLSFEIGDDILGEDQSNGWICLGLPEGYRVATGIKDIEKVYRYSAERKVLVQSDTLPDGGEACYFYCGKQSYSIPVFIYTGETAASADGWQLVHGTGEGFYWDAKRGTFFKASESPKKIKANTMSPEATEGEEATRAVVEGFYLDGMWKEQTQDDTKE